MSLITHDFTLSIVPGGVPPTLKLSQYDDARTFVAHMVDEHGADYSVAGTTVTLEGKNCAGGTFDIACTPSGADITFTPSGNATSEPGRITATLHIKKDSENISTLAVILDVQRAGATREDVANDPGFKDEVDEAAAAEVAAWIERNHILLEGALLGRVVGTVRAPEVLDTDWELGTINSTTGLDGSSPKLIRTPMYAFSGRVRMSGLKHDGSAWRLCRVYCYDGSRQYLGRVSLISALDDGAELLSGTRFIRFDYGFHSTNTDQTVESYGMASLIADFGVELMGGDDYAPKQERSVVGAMIAVAETYLDVAYSDNDQIVYESNHGIYTDNPKKSNGLKATSCSQFFKALITGTPYARSRYVQDKNEPALWGYEYDSSTTAVFVGTRGAMSSHQIAKYCAEKGWLVPFDADHNNIRPGDVLFWTSTSPDDKDNYLKINHVALCYQIFAGGCYIIHSGGDRERPIYDGDPITAEEGVGVETYRVSFAASWSPAYYARMPLLTGEHMTRLLMMDEAVYSSTYDLSNSNDSSIPVAVYQYGNLPRGFYTMQWEDTGDGESYIKVNPGTNYYFDGQDSPTNGINIKAFRQGSQYRCVFYAYKPISEIVLRVSSGSMYNVSNVRLYRGYRM